MNHLVSYSLEVVAQATMFYLGMRHERYRSRKRAELESVKRTRIDPVQRYLDLREDLFRQRQSGPLPEAIEEWYSRSLYELRELLDEQQTAQLNSHLLKDLLAMKAVTPELDHGLCKFEAEERAE